MARKQPEPMDLHIGRQIKIRRMQLGMSQESLGDALGLTFQQVQKYEKGVNRVSGSRMAVICKTLKLNGPDDLFRNGPGFAKAGNGSDSSAVVEMLSTRTGIELAKLWPKLTSKQQNAVVGLVEQMVR